MCRLGLKDQQEREIVHVLMDCCLQEKSYNPFYAFLASKFCGYERRFQVTWGTVWYLHQALWALRGSQAHQREGWRQRKWSLCCHRHGQVTSQER